MSWDPDAWLLDVMETQGIGTEYSEYVDAYDWTGEMFSQQDYQVGVGKLGRTFTYQMQQLDNQLSNFGFSDSFMETEGEKGMYEDYSMGQEELAVDMGQDIAGLRKRYKDETYDYLGVLVSDYEVL